jgi:hypothetical protein
MSLLEKVLQARKQAEINKPSCEGCKHLIWLDYKTPFCKEKDKFILPDFPPIKCELREGEVSRAMEYKEAWQELKARLERADYEIWKLVDHKTSEDELKRLKGKHEGIAVALGYISETESEV